MTLKTLALYSTYLANPFRITNQIAIKFALDFFCGPQKMNLNDFGDSLTFLEPLTDQDFPLTQTLVCAALPRKVMARLPYNLFLIFIAASRIMSISLTFLHTYKRIIKIEWKNLNKTFLFRPLFHSLTCHGSAADLPSSSLQIFALASSFFF